MKISVAWSVEKLSGTGLGQQSLVGMSTLIAAIDFKKKPKCSPFRFLRYYLE